MCVCGCVGGKDVCVDVFGGGGGGGLDVDTIWG